MGEEQNNISLNKSTSQLPIYERPGRLDPDRHIPMDRRSRVDVNVHYDERHKGFYKVTNNGSPEECARKIISLIFDKQPKPESKIFVPELDTTEVRRKIKKPVAVQEPEPEIYIAEEDKAASSDYIADAFSGVETAEKREKKAAPVIDTARLKMYVLLLGVVVVLEVAGIALLAIL